MTCQILPPDFDAYQRYCPYTVGANAGGGWIAPDLARARELVRASGTAGQQVTVWIPEWIHIGAAAGHYVVSVLDSLGYRARLRMTPNPYAVEDKVHLQVGFSGWVLDFTAPAGFFLPTLTCGSYKRDSPANTNFSEFCDPTIDREIARAETLQSSDPQAAERLWRSIDRAVTDQAPWVPFANGVVLEVKSARVADYQYNPQWGTLFDQLWVK